MNIACFIKQLTYSSQDEKWGIYCTNIGRISLDKHTSYTSIINKLPRHYVMDQNHGRKINEYQIVYITDGFGFYTSEQFSQPINSGTIIIIFPNQQHRYSPEIGSSWTEHWVGFRGEYPGLLRETGILDIKNPVLNIGYNQTIMASFNSIIELIDKERSNKQQKISIEIMKIIEAISDIQNVDKNNDIHEIVIEKAKLFLHENLYNTLDVESMTRQLSINYKTLIELFRVHTDMTPYQFFLHMKIEKAKELLAAGEFSVKEISYRLEFQNPYYFSRLFKRKTGISPSQWGAVTVASNDIDID